MNLDYQHVLWDGDKPYWVDTQTGQRSYIPPLSAAQDSDPRLQQWAAHMGVHASYDKGHITGVQDSGTPAGGFFKDNATWNGGSGGWDQGANWGNILALGAGGMMAAPFMPALGGMFGGGAAGGGATTMGMSSALPGALSSVPALGGGAAAAATGGGVGGFLSGAGKFLGSKAGSTIVGAGTDMLSQVLGAHAAGAQQDASRESARQQFLASLLGSQADLAHEQLGDTQTRDLAYANHLTENPLASQQGMFRTAALGALARQGAPHIGPGNPGVQNTADFSGAAGQFLSPDALAAGASTYYAGIGGLSDTAPVPDLAGMGFGAAGSSRQAQLAAAIMASRGNRQGMRNTQQAGLGQAYDAMTGNSAPPSWAAATQPGASNDYFSRKGYTYNPSGTGGM